MVSGDRPSLFRADSSLDALNAMCDGTAMAPLVRWLHDHVG